MATGWRGWGRRQDVGQEAARKAGSAGERIRALSAIDDLWRRAEWSRLSEEERATALRPYASLTAPSAEGAEWTADATDAQGQAWLTDLVTPHLQPAATSVVRTWIEDGPSNTHLYAVGPAGRGKLSVVATGARRAMARRSPAPDYCYVPDPEALGHTLLLALPSASGTQFADSLGAALRQIIVNWEKPRERARGEATAEIDDETARQHLVTRHLEPLTADANQVVRPYLQRLQAALIALAPTSVTPQVVEVDLPAGRPQTPTLALPSNAPAEGGPSDTGAPVVVATLARMDLSRLLLRANGGVLVLNGADLVERDQPNGEWAALRSALRAETLPMRGTGEPPIPLSVRVALICSYSAARVLERAEDFHRLFRYKARFEEDADWTRDAEAAYAALAAGVVRHYAVPAFDATAVACLVEEGARRAPALNRSHLTTDVLTLRDIAVEAGRAARAAAERARGAAEPSGGHGAAEDASTTSMDVEAALAVRRLQQGVPARGAREDILAGREIVPTLGSAVGQVNGLGVIAQVPVEGRYAAPFRVTATVSPGRERLVDIEREAEVADSSHISGALTMAGYLAWRYGSQRPISVVARVRFEQEHGYVSGPSASAAELFALLSALAAVPVRAALAVTGAVGQHGELQLIGSANEKIEGFWEICRARRALGERSEGGYGILIPAANASDLMLRPEVARSIADESWFHIWPIADVDDGLPLLTGLGASEIHARVDRQLQRYYELALRDERR